jgi:hypothetical protein
MEDAMQAVSAELIQRVKALMVAEGVVLSDDIHQAEAAMFEFVQRLGAGLLNEHFSKKRSVTTGRAARATAARHANS